MHRAAREPAAAAGPDLRALGEASPEEALEEEEASEEESETDAGEDAAPSSLLLPSLAAAAGELAALGARAVAWNAECGSWKQRRHTLM